MNITNIRHIPSDPWIYLFKNKKGIILYIGKAKNLNKRVAQYFSPNSVWKQDMLSKADQIDFLIVKNESEALYLEDNLIKKNKPEFNNLLKADNSYAYIKITKEDFPQIFLTRKKFNDESLYIWPKHNTIHLKKFLQYLRQILKFRGCKAKQFKQWKLCSDYYFGICKGWCNQQTMKKEKLTSTEYKKIIKLIISFFKGNTLLVEKEIKSLIAKSIREENFERAAKLRDIYMHIQELVERQTVVIQKPITWYISQIKKIWKFHIYCVCNFYEGKLIDVIRGKESTDDMDKDELEKSLEREFIPHISVLLWEGGGPQSGGGFKLSKSNRKEINALMENFFDSYIISTSFEQENLNNDLLKQLQSRYHLKQFPYRIECIDISHLSWWWTSGGLSCFTEGLKNPKGYRRYKIKASAKSDDYAALQEVIERRTKTWNLPDLFILDGGKWQLGVIKKLYQNDKLKKIFDQTDIVSLGKWEARKKGNIWKKNKDGKIGEKIYYFDNQMKIKSENLVYDQADKILTKARDEAHRFANSYRKAQMRNEFK